MNWILLSCTTAICWSYAQRRHHNLVSFKKLVNLNFFFGRNSIQGCHLSLDRMIVADITLMIEMLDLSGAVKPAATSALDVACDNNYKSTHTSSVYPHIPGREFDFDSLRKLYEQIHLKDYKSKY